MAHGKQSTQPLEYASALAAQLVRFLGYEAAEKTCQENHWDGVLEAVRAQRSQQHH